MVTRVTQSIAAQKRRFIIFGIAFALVAGLLVSFVVTPNAQADYATACGYGYNSSGTFGYGSGDAFGYGYGYGGTFHFGYGDQVCPLFVTSSTLPVGKVGVVYHPAVDRHWWHRLLHMVGCIGRLPRVSLFLAPAPSLVHRRRRCFLLRGLGNGHERSGPNTRRLVDHCVSGNRQAASEPHPTRIIGTVRSRKTSNITSSVRASTASRGSPRVTRAPAWWFATIAGRS